MDIEELLQRLFGWMPNPVVANEGQSFPALFSGLNLGPLQTNVGADPHNRPTKTQQEYWDSLSPQEQRQTVEQIGAQMMGDPFYGSLFADLVQQESGYNRSAVSSAGAIGLGQLMPATAKDLGVDPNAPFSNLRGAATYLGNMLERYEGNVNMALAAYNAGPGRVDSEIRKNPSTWYEGLPAETRKYLEVLGTPLVGPDGQTALSAQEQLDAWLQANQQQRYLGLEDFEAAGLPPDQAYQALLEQFGIRPKDASSDPLGFANQRTAAARQRADQAFQAGQLAQMQGNLELAQKQFDAANYWSGQAMQQERADFGFGAQETAAGAAGDFFTRDSNDRFSRNQSALGAGGLFDSLAGNVGNLADMQARLGMELLTNPRNATTAFLMGKGVDSGVAGEFGQFNVQNLLGIDPAQIQDLINRATQAGDQVMARSNEPSQFNLQDYLDALTNAANQAAAWGGFEGFGDPGGIGDAPELNFDRPVGGTVTSGTGDIDGLIRGVLGQGSGVGGGGGLINTAGTSVPTGMSTGGQMVQSPTRTPAQLAPAPAPSTNNQYQTIDNMLATMSGQKDPSVTAFNNPPPAGWAAGYDPNMLALDALLWGTNGGY